jgi:hypothetical protein
MQDPFIYRYKKMNTSKPLVSGLARLLASNLAWQPLSHKWAINDTKILFQLMTMHHL